MKVARPHCILADVAAKLHASRRGLSTRAVRNISWLATATLGHASYYGVTDGLPVHEPQGAAVLLDRTRWHTLRVWVVKDSCMRVSARTLLDVTKWRISNVDFSGAEK